jgi:replicative DNA helicase
VSRDALATERAFIGCILRSPHEFWPVSDVVQADMLVEPHHRDIFGAIRDASERGSSISLASLTPLLPEEYEESGPTIGILAALKENAAEAGSAVDYAPFIAEQAARRRLGNLSDWLKKESSKADSNAEDIAATAAAQLQEIMASAAPVRPVRLAEATKSVITSSTKTIETGRIPGFDTGLRALDEMTGMLMGGDFIAVIGALGDGKSALLRQIGEHIAGFKPVLAAHNEMSVEQNATRAIADYAGMSVRQVREGAYDFQGKDDIDKAQAQIERLQYHLYVNPKMTVRAIKSRALQLHRTVGLGAITIDGFTRLKTEGRHKEKWDRYEELTGAIKDMAIELNVPVLLAVQRTRMARRNDSPVPRLDDAMAPSMEMDADIMLGVWREESWLMMNKPPQKAGGEAMDEWEGKMRRAKGTAKIIALKVRSGQPFESREFAWHGSRTRFGDL